MTTQLVRLVDFGSRIIYRIQTKSNTPIFGVLGFWGFGVGVGVVGVGVVFGC